MSCIDKELKSVLDNRFSFDEITKLKLLEVLFLAAELVKKYQVEYIQFEFRNHFNALGTCSVDGERITLLLEYAINNDLSEIEQTILHEIAHALVGCEHGHNIIWQEQAKKMGVKLTLNYRK